MNEIMLNFLIIIMTIAIIMELTFIIFFKRKDVSIWDSFFSIPQKYGYYWRARNPILYYRQSILKYLNIPLYILCIAFLMLLLLTLFT